MNPGRVFKKKLIDVGIVSIVSRMKGWIAKNEVKKATLSP